MQPAAALELDGLTKVFFRGGGRAPLRAVDKVSFSLSPGEVVGLLGPNGCGKSTVLKLILGLVRPTAGVCRIFGRDGQQAIARQAVGYVPQAPRFPAHLTGVELVRLHARLAGVPGGELPGRADRVLATSGLGAAGQRRIGEYSEGMRQRLGLAQALVHDPALLLLDEPTAALDPPGAAEVLALIRQLKAAGKTVLLTSHLLSQVETVCDRVVLLDRGRQVAAGPLEALATQAGRHQLLVDALSESEQAHLRAWLGERGRTLHAVEPVRVGLESWFAARASRSMDGEGVER